MGNLTANFDKDEFRCPCGCGDNNISLAVVNRLQVIRDIAKEPIIILSGCRCMAHNLKVGGEPQSYHLVGQAVDWTLGDKEKLKDICTMISEWSGGFHYYPDKLFCHTDVGRKRRW